MRSFFVLAVLVGGIGSADAATFNRVDLNNFFFFPGDPVAISSDGATADFNESPTASPVVLSNDPFLGDPGIVIPSFSQFLRFDFFFVEPPSNDDEFFAFLFDGVTGASFGSAFEFSTTATSSGTVSFDVRSLAGQTIGMQFSLNSLPGDNGFTDSILTVSELRVGAVEPPAYIPLPASLPLLAGAMAGLGLIARRRKALTVGA